MKKINKAFQSQPKVSVCISAYNHEKYISQALESVLSQSYENMEVLVIDDASTDGTPAVIKIYADQYSEVIKFIPLSQNVGVSAACNKLFDLAVGEFIAFLGSDDRMLPQRIEKQVNYLVDNPECIGVFSDISAINEFGEVDSKLKSFELLFNQDILNIRRQLLTGNFVNGPSMMVRSKDLTAVKGFNTLLRYTQDYDLWGKLLKRGELVKIPEKLTEYRVHGSNLSIADSGCGIGFQMGCEMARTAVNIAKHWNYELILLKPINCQHDYVAVLLELIVVFELVDFHYVGKPSFGCSYAYELALEIGSSLPSTALVVKSHLESTFRDGFHDIWRPLNLLSFAGFQWGWFEEHRLALMGGRWSDDCSRWLSDRNFSEVQASLITHRLESIAMAAKSFLVVILDFYGDKDGVEKTIQSIIHLIENGVKNLKIAIFSSCSSVFKKMESIFPEDQCFLFELNLDLNLASQVNSALFCVDYEWLVFVYPGAVFTKSGLILIMLELTESEDISAVYADEMNRLPNGELGSIFRPDFNLDLLLSLPSSMVRNWLFRKEVFLEVGGLGENCIDALEFDLVLKVFELKGIQRIKHVSEVLLINPFLKLRENKCELKILERHLKTRGYHNSAVYSEVPGHYYISYGHSCAPLVSIFIVAGGNLSLLQRCVESILEKTAYFNYEILIIDLGYGEVEQKKWLFDVGEFGGDKVRVVCFESFSSRFEAYHNAAINFSRGDYLVFLDYDTAVIEERWLDELLNHALRPEVAIVGAKLFRPDGKIEQAGIILGLNGPADRGFVGLSMADRGYMNRLIVDQNYTAVSSACFIIKKEAYDQSGGFDYKNFGLKHADLDLCLKVSELGYLAVWTPRAVLICNGCSREEFEAAEDFGLNKAVAASSSLSRDRLIYDRWISFLARDPAYNKNLSLSVAGGFSLAGVEVSWSPLSSWSPLPLVLVHPADNMGCGHYRMIQPFNLMKSKGLVDGSMKADYLLNPAEFERYSPDAVILQRPLSEGQINFMSDVKRLSSSFVVYELDDYLQSLPLKSVHKKDMPRDVLKSLRSALSFADRFVVSTDALAEAFADYHSDIKVIKNRLNPSIWDGLSNAREFDLSKRPRVGWAGGIGHTGDLEMILDVIKELADEVDWVFFGMTPVENMYVKEFHPGVPIEIYPSKLAGLNLDLAIAPLEQNKFNECKSNLRLLEYGICGYPVICSDIRCYSDDALPVTRVKNRFRDWVSSIRDHINNREYLVKLGSNLQAAVRADWMLEGGHLTDWKNAWLPKS